MPNRIQGASWTDLRPVAERRPSAPARFKASREIDTGVDEASDVVALSKGRFLVVSDTKDSVRIVGADGSSNKMKLPDLKNGNSQLEGVAYDPVRKNLFVMREEKGELLRYSWDAEDDDSEPELDKRIELDFAGPKNKGVEGLAYLPGTLSPTGTPQLLMAHEGSPRKVFFVDDKGTSKPKELKLEKEVRDALRDFSAVAVDPKTGDLFLSSDESRTVAQVRLVREGNGLVGKLVHAFPVRVDGDSLERIEGLTFDKQGNLYVLTENDGVLRKFERQ